MEESCSILTLPYLYEALADLYFSLEKYQKSQEFIDSADSHSDVYKYLFPNSYLSIKITKQEIYHSLNSNTIHIKRLTDIVESKEFIELDSFKISSTFSNLGIAYFDIGDIHNAVKYLKKSKSYTLDSSLVNNIEYYLDMCKIRYDKSDLIELHTKYCHCINKYPIENCQIIYLIISNLYLDLRDFRNALDLSLSIDTNNMNTFQQFSLYLNRTKIFSHLNINDNDIIKYLNREINNRYGKNSLNHLEYLVQQSENYIQIKDHKKSKIFADSAIVVAKILGKSIANKGLNTTLKLKSVLCLLQLKKEDSTCKDINKSLQEFLNTARVWNSKFQNIHSSTLMQREYSILLSQIIEALTVTHIANCPNTHETIIELIDFSNSFILGSKLNLITRSPKVKKLLLKQIHEMDSIRSLDQLTNLYFLVSDSVERELIELMDSIPEIPRTQWVNTSKNLTLQLFVSLNQQFSLLSSRDLTILTHLTPSHDLYKQIFPPDIDWSKYDHLTIVPDGDFHNFSFESLLTSDEPYDHPRDAPYLFKKIPISYSLGLHLGRDYSEYVDQGLQSVSFAPEFLDQAPSATRDCQEDRYGQLVCNQEEAKLVSTITQGTYFTGENATIENFKESIDKHNFFHLATHACIDTNNYYESSLIFQDGRLPMSELYETDWNNKTVVLSACNTAQGAMVSGEGVFNFARTLTELGCKEVIVSLWPIDDCSTKEFIAIFYQYIQDGLTTAKALQQARITFLEKADKLHADPYFWAPLVLISNDINIGSKPTTQWPSYVGGGILALGLMGWGFKHYRSSRAA